MLNTGTIVPPDSGHRCVPERYRKDTVPSLRPRPVVTRANRRTIPHAQRHRKAIGGILATVLRTLWAALFIVGFGAKAIAADANISAPATQPTAQLEEVVVTGTHIKGIDAETIVPVQVVTSEVSPL